MKVDRPHGADPRHLRAARAQPRGQGAGGARPAELPPAPAARVGRGDVAAGRRHRHAGPRRDEDGGRPPAHPQADLQAAARHQGHGHHARDEARAAAGQRASPRPRSPGYTNAGKSTLMNAITGADVLVADQLFATLDPTVRRLKLPGGRRCTVSDTVGFVSKLPHDLVEAFRSTLEEVTMAELIVHVADAVLAGARRADRGRAARPGRDRGRRHPRGAGPEQDRPAQRIGAGAARPPVPGVGAGLGAHRRGRCRACSRRSMRRCRTPPSR